MNCAFFKENKCVNMTIRGSKCVGSKCKKLKVGVTNVTVETPIVTATTVISIVEDTVDTVDVTEAVECEDCGEQCSETNAYSTIECEPKEDVVDEDGIVGKTKEVVILDEDAGFTKDKKPWYRT